MRNQPITVDRINEITNEVYVGLVEEEKKLIKETSYDDLILFHHTAGRFIRNEYSLWNYPWTPEIVDGVDESPLHPDAVSMQVIRGVWIRLQKES